MMRECDDFGDQSKWSTAMARTAHEGARCLSRGIVPPDKWMVFDSSLV